MEKVILTSHIILAITLVVLILLQQGKGASSNASFGAEVSQTVFGGSGSGDFLNRSTALVATGLFVTSVSLAMHAKYETKNMYDIENQDNLSSAIIAQPKDDLTQNEFNENGKLGVDSDIPKP
jgi:preprotein translocase subunit SecG